jgi:lysophospholipase L1-like esterase
MNLVNKVGVRLSVVALTCAAQACEPEMTVPPAGPPPTGGSTRPPCVRSGSQVVALGDSYMSLPVMLVPRVEALAQASGALSFGDAYRDYSVPGTTLGSPIFPGEIPYQLDSALADDPNIAAVIMTGGGNDIIASLESILAGCLDVGASQNPTCTGIIDGAMDVARQISNDARSAGVHDVVYFLYPHVPIGGDEILDYSVDRAKRMAAELSSATFKVHLVDTRQAFEGHYEYFDLDPVHANDTGGDVIASLVWQTMKNQCIAQPAGSGCCQP